MKVLMFGWEFPPVISGGLGTACFGLTKGMAELGIHIDFVLPNTMGKPTDDPNSPVNLIDASNIEIKDNSFQLNTDEKYINLMSYDSAIRPYQNEETYISTARKREELINKIEEKRKIGIINFKGGYGKTLIEEVYRLRVVGHYLGKNTDADIIHAHDWMTFPAAIETKKASGLPLVVHIHATEYDRIGEIVYSKTYEIEKEGMENADRIVAVSQRTKTIITDYYGIPADKIDVVHNAVIEKNAVDCKVEKKIKEPLVLFLGRITSQKGPAYFLEVARLVLKKRKDIRFVMAGSGDLLSDMIHLCAKMGIQDNFHFTGFLQGENLKQAFQICDMMVMPSVSEPFGLVPMEALRYNMPVIISKQSGVAEVLPHAHKVDFWDTELVAKTIIKIIDNPSDTKANLQQNLKTLTNINWTKSALILTKTYEKLLNK